MESVRRDLLPYENDNRLVPRVQTGKVDRSTLAALAAEEHRIVASDWRSFLTLASNAPDQPTREYFSGLAQGEGIALAALPPLAEALGMDAQAVRAYQPTAGCQAYPAYLAWLALNAEPAEVVVAVTANFAAWGSYCAAMAAALREQYGLDEESCAFFDFFATPAPEIENQAIAAVQAGMDAGRVDDSRVREYGGLFQSYELMFWNSLID
ncbi:hypothetical protein GCM10027563_26250 [Parasphingorhabdus pacifica]